MAGTSVQSGDLAARGLVVIDSWTSGNVTGPAELPELAFSGHCIHADEMSAFGDKADMSGRAFWWDTCREKPNDPVERFSVPLFCNLLI